MRTVVHHTLPEQAKREQQAVQHVQTVPPMTPQDGQKIVHFRLDHRRYALPVSDVLTVERAVQITSVPKAPASVAGVINFHGAIIPVLDLRKLFGLPPRALRLEDRFIIARTSQGLVAFVADSVAGVSDHNGRDRNTAGTPIEHSKHATRIITKDHGIVLLANLEGIISPDEQHLLDQALEGQK